MEREPGRSGDRLLSESYPDGYQIRVLRAPPAASCRRQFVTNMGGDCKVSARSRTFASSSKIRVSRLAAMAADCKSAGLSYVGSSPTWPTKRNRAASLRKPPNMNIISHLFSPVHSQFLQLFASILMEHPILKNPIPGCIIKIQKRSESNVLSKLPINKIYRK